MMILNQSQAKAAYDCMCAMNNVSGMVKCEWFEPEEKGDGINVFELKKGKIRVNLIENYTVKDFEIYQSQSEFAEAYGV